MFPSFLDAFGFHFLLPFEHIASCFRAGFIDLIPYPFSLEQVEEALRDRVVMAVPMTAQGVFQIVRFEERHPIHAGDLGTLVGMHQYLVLWLSAPHRHESRLQDNVRGLTNLKRPTDNATGVEVDYGSQIGEALLRFYIGDVDYPNPVWRIYVDLPVQLVLDNYRWFAAIDARTVPVTD